MITKSNSGACVISPRAAFRRRSITSGGSCPRWSRRARSASIDGGRMNTPTACGKCRLTCCAPCQSISSNTSLPSPRRCSIHWREVPYQLACTCAVSRNSPRALRAANSSRSTKWYSRPCASPDRGARVVNETDSRIAGSRFSSALTRLDLPAPEGAATRKTWPVPGTTPAPGPDAGAAAVGRLIRGSGSARASARSTASARRPRWSFRSRRPSSRAYWPRD